MRGSGPDRGARTDRAGATDEIVAADRTVRSGRIGKAMAGHGVVGNTMTRSTMGGETVCGRRMDGADVSRAAPETGATHADATAAGVKAATTDMKTATAGVKTTAAAVEAAPAAMTTTASAAVSTTTATTVAGRRCTGANKDHGRPGQKREGKLAFHVTPRPLGYPTCACKGALVRNRNCGKLDAVSTLASQICARLHCGIRSLEVCPDGRPSSNLHDRNADHEHRMGFFVSFHVSAFGNGRLDT
jgi:hypothetical protein